MPDQLPLQFRLMDSNDLEEVMRIEKLAHPYPWTEGIFKDCLRVGYLCRVLESTETHTIYAYGILSFGAGEAHILNITVDPQYQRRGYGRLMMQQLLDDARTLEVGTVLLEVRVSNAPAIALYDSLGFNEIGIRPNYYPAKKGKEDALMFAKVLLSRSDC